MIQQMPPLCSVSIQHLPVGLHTNHRIAPVAGLRGRKQDKFAAVLHRIPHRIWRLVDCHVDI